MGGSPLIPSIGGGTPSGNAGGALTGTYPNPGLANINGPTTIGASTPVVTTFTSDSGPSDSGGTSGRSLISFILGGIKQWYLGVLNGATSFILYDASVGTIPVSISQGLVGNDLTLSSTGLALTGTVRIGTPASGSVATLATAATITPITPIVNLTGAVAINTITLPSYLSSSVGGWITFIPASTVLTTTSGNILAIYSLIANKVYQACYNGSKWIFTGSGI